MPRPQWTPEQAASFSRKGWEASRDARRNGHAALSGLGLLTSEQAACVRDQLRIVSEQIIATRSTLNAGAMEPHHRAQLLKALDTLLDRQRVLNNIPTPGQLRPVAPRQQARARISSALPPDCSPTVLPDPPK